jgi:hypothetical protein
VRREMGVDSPEASRCRVIYRRGEGQKRNSTCELVCARYRVPIPKGKGDPFFSKKKKTKDAKWNPASWPGSGFDKPAEKHG